MLAKNNNRRYLSVRTVDNVRLLRLLLQDVRRVEIAVDDAHIWEHAAELGRLLLVAHQGGEFPVRVGVVQRVEGVAADVAGGAGTDE